MTLTRKTSVRNTWSRFADSVYDLNRSDSFAKTVCVRFSAHVLYIVRFCFISKAHGRLMGPTQWNVHGFIVHRPMGRPRGARGSHDGPPMGFPWVYSTVPWVAHALVYMWCWAHGSPMGILWVVSRGSPMGQPRVTHRLRVPAHGSWAMSYNIVSGSEN